LKNQEKKLIDNHLHISIPSPAALSCSKRAIKIILYSLSRATVEVPQITEKNESINPKGKQSQSVIIPLKWKLFGGPENMAILKTMNGKKRKQIGESEEGKTHRLPLLAQLSHTHIQGEFAVDISANIFISSGSDQKPIFRVL